METKNRSQQRPLPQVYVNICQAEDAGLAGNMFIKGHEIWQWLKCRQRSRQGLPPSGLYWVPILYTSLLIYSAGRNTRSLTSGKVKTENQWSGSGSGSDSGSESTGSTCFWIRIYRIRIQRSISQRHGSVDPDPDPHQNVMDPEHCWKQWKGTSHIPAITACRQECQAFSPVVRIGSPFPHPQASVALHPFGSGGGTHSLTGEGAGGPNSKEGQALWFSDIVYSLYACNPLTAKINWSYGLWSVDSMN